jgi:hypothetical protein
MNREGAKNAKREREREDGFIFSTLLRVIRAFAVQYSVARG